MSNSQYKYVKPLDTNRTKVHYKGENDDFVVFVESKEAVENYRKGNGTVPLVEVLDGKFFVYTTHKEGNTGHFDAASKALLHSNFGSDKEEDAIKTILLQGDIIEGGRDKKQDNKNSQSEHSTHRHAQHMG